MSAIITDLAGRLRLGRPASDGGLTIVPVFGEFPGAPLFVTLEEAMAANSLVITEVSEGGSVPTLKASNSGSVGVLILDGEELAGAKQNRVLNTTVYIRPGQEIMIPVSCTEAGRWAYQSHDFDDSGYLAAKDIRVAANESVTGNLRMSLGFKSDQGRVWDEVGKLQVRHGRQSPTSAARDVYEHKAEDMRRREAAFACLPGQIGVVALWSGRVAGLDVIGSGKAYARLHGRLVRSYALDAPAGAPSQAPRDLQAAADWLAALGRVQTTEHESPGAGVSYRFTGAGVVGSALAVDGAVLHAVALATQTQDAPVPDEGRYPGFFERRGHFPW